MVHVQALIITLRVWPFMRGSAYDAGNLIVADKVAQVGSFSLISRCAFHVYAVQIVASNSMHPCHRKYDRWKDLLKDNDTQ